jgi:DNA-binding response OmpR family regulator
MEPIGEESPHILLVEDDPTLSHLYSGMLERAGYRVTKAHTVAEALEVLKQKPTLVVVDWFLPDGSGAMVCEQAHQQDIRLPVLLLSGKANSHNLVDNDIHVNAWLSKPVLPESLLFTIEQLLENSVKGN